MEDPYEELPDLKVDTPPSETPDGVARQTYLWKAKQFTRCILAVQRMDIDWQLLAKRGLVAEDSAVAEISQQFRRVKRPLLRQLFESYPVGADEVGRVLLVASASTSEGKSFTSLNLALAIAIEPELQVLLIDGDAPKQGLTQSFGLEDKDGLLDLAADNSVKSESCIYETDREGLFFLPAGKRRSNSPELLGSSRTRELLTGLANTSGPCVIIIDSPPVLLANEARALLSSADQTLFVVRSGATSAMLVESALESIGSNKNLSMLLNDSASATSSEFQYGYGYDYGDTIDEFGGRGG